MSTRYERYDREDGFDDSTDAGTADREISLGTTTILGIFLALALVCAVFFGFGYSMGRRSVPSALANVNTGISAPLPENRLIPGSLPGSSSGASTYVPPTERGTDGAANERVSGAKAPAAQKTKVAAATTVVKDTTPAAAPPVEDRQQPARAVGQTRPDAVPVPRTVGPAATAGTAGPTYVQVTAISVTHRSDAEMLVGSLRRRGYSAAIHAGAADDLLHVQLGPFATKKEAEAMRQRLSVDGYNSILK